jgi:phosphatidate cytidylyltransferase
MKKKSSDLKNRFLVGSVFIILIAILLPNAFNPTFGILIGILFAALCGMAVWEFMVLLEKKKLQTPKFWVVLGSVLYILTTFFATNFFSIYNYAIFDYLPMFVLFLTVFLIFIFHLHSFKNSLAEIGGAVFGLVYISVPMGLMLRILFQPYIWQDGRAWLLYLIVLTKGTDIAAYFIGRFFGKKKLAPNLSPKKTWAGAIGGVLFALCLSLAAHSWLHYSEVWKIRLDLTMAIVLGLLIPILGQVGDLAESLIKRDVGAKDSSFLPGLGGVFDILDALLFTTPLLYFYLRLINVL